MKDQGYYTLNGNRVSRDVALKCLREWQNLGIKKITPCRFSNYCECWVYAESLTTEKPRLSRLRIYKSTTAKTMYKILGAVEVISQGFPQVKTPY